MGHLGHLAAPRGKSNDGISLSFPNIDKRVVFTQRQTRLRKWLRPHVGHSRAQDARLDIYQAHQASQRDLTGQVRESLSRPPWVWPARLEHAVQTEGVERRPTPDTLLGQIIRPRTCEGVKSSSAHSRLNTAFSRLIKIVRGAVRTSIVPDGGILHLHANGLV